MTGLFKLQTALVNVPGEGLPELHQEVDFIRQTFRYTWEHIKIFFQKCHSFGSDVSKLKESLGTESANDCMEFLDDMSGVAVDLLAQTQELLDDSGSAAKEFEQRVPGFSQHLQQATRASDEKFPVSQATSPLPSSHHSNETASFIAANLAAAYPDGSKALDDTQMSLDGITSSLETIKQFWESTSNSCQIAVKHGRLNITVRQAEILAERWEGYQRALRDSINSITKTGDVLLVSPLGAPQPAPMSPLALQRASRSNRRQRSHSPRDSPPPQPGCSPRWNVECWIVSGVGLVAVMMWIAFWLQRRDDERL